MISPVKIYKFPSTRRKFPNEKLLVAYRKVSITKKGFPQAAFKTRLGTFFEQNLSNELFIRGLVFERALCKVNFTRL